MPQISSLDHLVLTVADIDATLRFYRDCLGMTAEAFEAGGQLRQAVRFGDQKINLHQAGREFEPKSAHPMPGSADLCFLSQTPLADWMAHLTELSIPIEEGPVARTGARFALTSIYLRDPDQNLIEISNRV